LIRFQPEGGASVAGFRISPSPYQFAGIFVGALYESASPFPQAILLAKAVGRPVKVIWSREEEFLRDALRPMGLVRLRAGLDAQGLPVALEAEAVGEGPRGRWFGRKPDAADLSVTEGIAGKPYAIPNRRIAHLLLLHPTIYSYQPLDQRLVLLRQD
jgi:isoquinoline 1-oxidoreductase subunit beta